MVVARRSREAQVARAGALDGAAQQQQHAPAGREDSHSKESTAADEVICNMPVEKACRPCNPSPMHTVRGMVSTWALDARDQGGSVRVSPGGHELAHQSIILDTMQITHSQRSAVHVEYM